MTAEVETMVPSGTGRRTLHRGVLGQIEQFGQSIANVAPTLTPTANVPLVVALSGLASWPAFAVGTIGLIFVAAAIGVLAARHTQSGSFFIYIGRNFGPMTGAIAAWGIILAYLATAIAEMSVWPLFIGNVLTPFGITSTIVPLWVFGLAATVMVGYACYHDIKLSSRASLVLETISVGVVVVIAAMVIGVHGTAIDTHQLAMSNMHGGLILAGLPLVVFSFVGFESAATLAGESANPKKSVPRAVMGTVIGCGIFFMIVTYIMIFGIGDNVTALGNSGSPFQDVAKAAGLSQAGTVIGIAALISAFACAMASINAAARLIFSMGRYGFLHNAMGDVHEKHGTPHIAVIMCTVFVFAVTAALYPLGYLNGYGYAGTIASFGFVVVYLLMCVAAPMELHREGALKLQNIVIALGGVLIMAVVAVGGVYPVPSYPYNLMPYIFLAYMVVGGLYFAWLKAKAPESLSSLMHDMEI